MANYLPPLFGRCWPARSHQLLLTAALASDGRAVDAWRNWQAQGHLGGMDEGSFRLLPMVYHNLHERGFDDPVMSILKGVFRRAWVENQSLLHDLLPIVSALEAAGTRTLLLKGPALAARYYANVGLRPMRDVDVLVPSGEEASRAIADLRRAGWAQWTWTPARVGPAFWRFRHAVSLINSRKHELDVHWHVLFRCCRASVDEGFWGRAVPLEIMGTKTRALDATDQLLLACSHGLEHTKRAVLRWVVDAVMILRSPHQIDWQRLLDFVLDERLILPTRDALALLRDAFGAPIPAGVVERLANGAVSWAERAEGERFLDEVDQSLLVATAGLYTHHRRSTRDQSGVRSAASFLRYMQYYWELDSLPSLLPRGSTWVCRWVRRAMPAVRWRRAPGSKELHIQ